MNVTNSTGAEGLVPWNFNGELRVKAHKYDTKELEKKEFLMSQLMENCDVCVHCVSTYTERPCPKTCIRDGMLLPTKTQIVL